MNKKQETTPTSWSLSEKIYDATVGAVADIIVYGPPVVYVFLILGSKTLLLFFCGAITIWLLILWGCGIVVHALSHYGEKP